MKFSISSSWFLLALSTNVLAMAFSCNLIRAHGTVAYPKSRVYRVRFETNSAPILQQARSLDANPSDSYFTWNQISQFVPTAANENMSSAFDYSSWVPNEKMSSGNHRFDNWVENGGVIDDGLDFSGLDIVSNQWPTTNVQAGQKLQLDFLASAPHSPSVFDVWMTTADWAPDEPLSWNKMQVIGEFWNRHEGGKILPKYGQREEAIFDPDGEFDQGINSHYYLEVTIPLDRTGHHVIWLAWQRDDPAGEVFFSASDVFVDSILLGDVNLDGQINLLDIAPFVDLLSASGYQVEADINQDNLVNLLDVRGFVDLLSKP